MGYPTGYSPYVPTNNINIHGYNPRQFTGWQNLQRGSGAGSWLSRVASAVGKDFMANPGGYFAAAGQVGGEISNITSQVRGFKDMETQDASTTDPITGRPILNTADVNSKLDTIGNPDAQGKGTILSSTLQGAAAGTNINPGLGTVIGAAAGFIGGLVGRHRIRVEAEDARDRLLKQKRNDIADYNKDVISYSDMNTANMITNARKQKQMENSYSLGVPAYGTPIYGI